MESIDANFSKVELGVSEKAMADFKQSARWGTFLAVVGFVLSGFMVLAALVMLLLAGRIPSSQLRGLPFDTSVFAIIYLLMAVFYFFPNLYLIQYSSKMKNAIDQKDSNLLEQSAKNLKNMFQFVGISTIVVIVLYIVLIMFAAVAGTLR